MMTFRECSSHYYYSVHDRYIEMKNKEVLTGRQMRTKRRKEQRKAK